MFPNLQKKNLVEVNKSKHIWKYFTIELKSTIECDWYKNREKGKEKWKDIALIIEQL